MACPVNSYKTNRCGTRRIQEHFRKLTSQELTNIDMQKINVVTSSQNKSNDSKWSNYLVSPAFAFPASKRSWVKQEPHKASALSGMRLFLSSRKQFLLDTNA